MSLKNIRTNAHERGFVDDILSETNRLDIGLSLAVPIVLLVVYLLPESTLDPLVFDTTSPSLLAAYTAHFVHFDRLHLLGNLSVYLPVIGIAYLLCVLSERRQLFRIAFITLIFAFPFALSAMQLIFPRERLIFGFSGINAGFVGLVAFALTGYLGANISQRVDERDSPAVLFVLTGLIALVALPADAFRFEISTAAFVLAGLYLGVALSRQGLPTTVELRTAVDRPGYIELAGGSLGLLVGYPLVAFQSAVVPEGEVVDVYIHLLGFALAFIVVFSYVFVVKSETAYQQKKSS